MQPLITRLRNLQQACRTGNALQQRVSKAAIKKVFENGQLMFESEQPKKFVYENGCVNKKLAPFKIFREKVDINSRKLVI